jgi:hypothetical protein
VGISIYIYIYIRLALILFKKNKVVVQNIVTPTILVRYIHT